jgi:hypothetical protein
MARVVGKKRPASHGISSIRAVVGSGGIDTYAADEM